jgi:structure-specific recognition protein 1
MASDLGIRVMMKSGQMYRFGGFNESDNEKLAKYFARNYSIDLKTREYCLRGWNWGTANFDGAVLGFDIKKSDKAFEFPLSNVSHCTTGKNEVTLEFHHNDEAPVSLMEMRFHIPTVDGVDPVQAFVEQVLEKASIIQATGESIATFKELQCLTPRGRYDIKIFPTFIQLHGKTFDYKIPITSVLRLFQLPHKDSRQVFFVMSLDPPIKQGQTRYHFLILLFNKDEELAIELGISEREIREKYEGKLQKNMSGPVFEVLAKLMRVLVQRKITLPDPSFCSPKDIPVITCSYRASAGLLYPLDRGFMYVHKPPIHIRFEEIMSINFARSGGSTRSFDFEVETKSGFVHTFSSIEKEEYSKLFDFVSKKKLRVKNRGTETSEKGRKDRNDDEIIDSDLEDEPDAYLQRVREEGRIREEGGDSDESDESFNPGRESDDVAEEFDSNASASSSEDSDDDEGSHKKKKKEKEKPKKEKKKKEKDREKKRKSKKEKDENKPKRPQTAFFLWMNENREKIKKENPGISLTEVTKKAGELWKEKVKDKSKWEQKAAEAKKIYEKEMAEYKANAPSEKERKSSPKKSDKPKSESKKTKSPTKTSSQFKSKEYISDSDSSSSDDSDKKSKKKSKKDKSKSSKKKEDSDQDMKSASESEEVESTPESDDDSD